MPAKPTGMSKDISRAAGQANFPRAILSSIDPFDFRYALIVTEEFLQGKV
jgi:hypothetical protein